MELNITWGKVLLVWWAFTWRTVVGGAAVGMVAGLIAVTTRMEPASADAFILIVSLAFSLVITIVCFRLILGRKLGKIRLVLVETETGDLPRQ